MKKTLNINQKQIWKFVIKIVLISIVGFVGGATFTSFFDKLEPSIIPTGLSGFAKLINTWIGGAISTSIIYLILNVIIFAFALKFFGWKFLLLSGFGLGAYVLGMEFGFIPEIINSVKDVGGYHLLLCVVGSIISGFVVGITIRLGGSTGGSDVLGKLLNRAFPKVKTGHCILFINIIVLTLSIITGGLQTGLYALVNAIIGSLVTNMVLDSSKKIIAYYIICDKPKEIADAILTHYDRGVTRIDGTGMFTGNDKAILLCLVPYDQSYKMREFVLAIDENAFVFSSPVTQTIGENNLMNVPASEKKKKSTPAVISPTETQKLIIESNAQMAQAETKAKTSNTKTAATKTKSAATNKTMKKTTPKTKTKNAE